MSACEADDRIDWQALNIAGIATVAEAKALEETLTLEMADIDAQLEMASARREVGEPFDPIWYARAKIALKHRGRLHQQLLQRLSVLAREGKQAAQRTEERAFIESAKAMLPSEQYLAIWDAAHKLRLSN